ncbi:MAG: cobalamin-dependent protein [Thermodesulfobacteriota bacterium]
MRIALIYAPWLEERAHTEDVVHPPMGVWFVAAALAEAGHEVEVLNWRAQGRDPRTAEAALRELAPDLVGFTVLQANRHAALDLARRAKAILPGVRTVLGGVAATFLWKLFLDHAPEVDFVIRGEGEQAMLRLAERLESGEERYDDLPNLAWRDGGVARANPCAEPLDDLDSLPNPARRYTYQHLALTRGCPGKCTFCGSPRFWGPKVRHHSPEYFVDQMEILHAKGVDHFYVSDDTFTLDKARARRVCELILERGLKVTWNAISRVDLVDYETLKLMRRAGCIQVSFGVESASEEVRSFLGKRITARAAREAFAAAHRAGLLARAYFIYGSPCDSAATIRDNIALIRELKPLVVHFFVLTLYPGSALYDRFRQEFRLGDETWLKPIEDVKYYELDPRLPERTVYNWGRSMKEAHHPLIPSFALDIAENLDPDPEMAPLHADFLTRLALTLLHGDLADNPAIPDKHKTAALLLERALRFAPEPSAYAALGSLFQQHRRYEESVQILSTGLGHFPQNPDITLALAVSLMNQGHFEAARNYLRPFVHLPHALHMTAVCHHHLGDAATAEKIMTALRESQQP